MNEKFFNKQSETPFKEELKDNKLSEIYSSDKFKEVESNPDKIVRIESFELLNDRYKNKIEPIELVKIANKLHAELETEYGIPVPADFLIGKDEKGDGVVYSVVDKIDGKNLWNKDIEISEEVITQIQKTYGSIAKYFFDKLCSGGFYLTDINGGGQYVFGKKKRDSENKIYFIDTDIYINNSNVAIYTVVEWLTIHMSSLESKFNTKFDKAHEYINRFINQPLPEGINDSEKEKINNNIIGIKKYLSGERIGQGPTPAIPPFSDDNLI